MCVHPQARVRRTVADAWYTTGASHVVCQDYAVATTLSPDCTVAVVSDGCSSSPDTDVGARLVARAAIAQMRAAGPSAGHAAATVRRAAAAACVLGLPNEALDATLLTVRVAPQAIDIAVAGDGVVAVRHRDGTVEFWVVDHPQGAPPYPSYTLDPRRRERYLAHYGATLRVRHRNRDGTWATHERTTAPHWALDPKEIDLVLLGSDGLSAFVGNAPADDDSMDIVAPVNVDAVVRGLLAIPRLQGRFVARRGRRFMKTAARHGWRALDDVGLAAVAVGGEP